MTEAVERREAAAGVAAGAGGIVAAKADVAGTEDWGGRWRFPLQSHPCRARRQAATDEDAKRFGCMRLWLKILAPYVAVVALWFGGVGAWPTILAYHAQILFWILLDRRRLDFRLTRRSLAWALPFALAGPLVFVVLPLSGAGDMGEWLARYGLSGGAWVAMVLYFGLAHPALEQMHWAPLRRQTRWAHSAFAGYHALVLWTLLPAPWLAAVVAALTLASLAWKRMTTTTGLAGTVLAHTLADSGIAAAAWLLAR